MIFYNVKDYLIKNENKIPDWTVAYRRATVVVCIGFVVTVSVEENSVVVVFMTLTGVLSGITVVVSEKYNIISVNY